MEMYIKWISTKYLQNWSESKERKTWYLNGDVFEMIFNSVTVSPCRINESKERSQWQKFLFGEDGALLFEKRRISNLPSIASLNTSLAQSNLRSPVSCLTRSKVSAGRESFWRESIQDLSQTKYRDMFREFKCRRETNAKQIQWQQMITITLFKCENYLGLKN